MQQPIAVLDSGVGGLTVVKEIMRQLPNERLIYYGDTARAPYGSRSADEIVRFTSEIVTYFGQFRPKLIVIACNTATAVALEQVRYITKMPVIGVIEAGVRTALRYSPDGSIGIIGTEATIASKAYEKALLAIAPHIRVISKACPSFVPLVESGEYGTYDAVLTVQKEMSDLRMSELDSLILGCTHYPFLMDHIQNAVGNHVQLISSAEEVTKEVIALLEQSGERETVRDCGRLVHQIGCSGDPFLFKSIAERWLGKQVKTAPVLWHVPGI